LKDAKEFTYIISKMQSQPNRVFSSSGLGRGTNAARGRYLNGRGRGGRGIFPKSTSSPRMDISRIQEICAHSYLGKKGYTIPKEFLTPQEEAALREELTVAPKIFGTIGGGAEITPFPIYRENVKKIYLPRFFGISKYGLPPRTEIEDGSSISLEFVKELRDYQNAIISVYMDYLDTRFPKEYGGGAILEVPCGRGKTVMALKIISLVKQKTLIIVHKEFLMNQWIERIAEFLPSARVGKIQGPTFDIENKDIVIGMIQTIYDRAFEPEAFACFGLTIVDEVHRIGSEQFSKTLLKTITKYMLGISATVDRKDGLTRVIHMFIGDKIYTEKRKDEDPVCVRAIEYVSPDAEFNTTEYDYRGNPKYSTMIVKLCDFGPRSDFIIRVITDLMQEHPENQIMILGHNRSLLTYLHDSIEHKRIGTVGYYVGGMKQRDLQETESRQIVVATYAMAAEALDIKTLSTLVMVTPKTDIIQSVGRILRVRHENPIIVDIVDKHDVFQKQWAQRRAFYKKCNYRIRYIDSLKYGGMQLDWEADTTWRHVFEPKVCDINNEANGMDTEKTESKCLIDVSEFEKEEM
jgi:superfamily II DNA or RNA helicase